MRLARIFAGTGVLGAVALLAGCGDPIPPAAQASISIHLQEYEKKDPVYGMETCQPSRHWVDIPYDHDHTPTLQRQITDGTTAPERAVNNQDGDAVSCTVKANGSGFRVSGDAKAYAELSKSENNDAQKYSPSIVHIRIDNIGPGDSDATGTLAIQDDASINTYQADACTFSVSGESLGVQAGAIWGSVKCPLIADPKSPGSGCQVDVGYFVLENCGQ
jgi:hypothetical protein